MPKTYTLLAPLPPRAFHSCETSWFQFEMNSTRHSLPGRTHVLKVSGAPYAYSTSPLKNFCHKHKRRCVSTTGHTTKNSF
jgi:hypothetical protein